MAVHVHLADAFAVALRLDGGAEFFADVFDIGDGTDGDSGRAGVTGDEGEIAQAHHAEEQRLIHGVVFHAEEFQLIELPVQDAAGDLQALGGEFIRGAFGDPPADQPHDKRQEETDGGHAGGERGATNRGTREQEAEEIIPEVDPLGGVAFPEGGFSSGGRCGFGVHDGRMEFWMIKQAR